MVVGSRTQTTKQVSEVRQELGRQSSAQLAGFGRAASKQLEGEGWQAVGRPDVRSQAWRRQPTARERQFLEAVLEDDRVAEAREAVLLELDVALRRWRELVQPLSPAAAEPTNVHIGGGGSGGLQADAAAVAAHKTADTGSLKCLLNGCLHTCVRVCLEDLDVEKVNSTVAAAKERIAQLQQEKLEAHRAFMKELSSLREQLYRRDLKRTQQPEDDIQVDEIVFYDPSHYLEGPVRELVREIVTYKVRETTVFNDANAQGGSPTSMAAELQRRDQEIAELKETIGDLEFELAKEAKALQSRKQEAVAQRRKLEPAPVKRVDSEVQVGSRPCSGSWVCPRCGGACPRCAGQLRSEDLHPNDCQTSSARRPSPRASALAIPSGRPRKGSESGGGESARAAPPSAESRTGGAGPPVRKRPSGVASEEPSPRAAAGQRGFHGEKSQPWRPTPQAKARERGHRLELPQAPGEKLQQRPSARASSPISGGHSSGSLAVPSRVSSPRPASPGAGGAAGPPPAPGLGAAAARAPTPTAPGPTPTAPGPTPSAPGPTPTAPGQAAATAAAPGPAAPTLGTGRPPVAPLSPRAAAQAGVGAQAGVAAQAGAGVQVGPAKAAPITRGQELGGAKELNRLLKCPTSPATRKGDILNKVCVEEPSPGGSPIIEYVPEDRLFCSDGAQFFSEDDLDYSEGTFYDPASEPEPEVEAETQASGPPAAGPRGELQRRLEELRRILRAAGLGSALDAALAAVGLAPMPCRPDFHAPQKHQWPSAGRCFKDVGTDACPGQGPGGVVVCPHCGKGPEAAAAGQPAAGAAARAPPPQAGASAAAHPPAPAGAGGPALAGGQTPQGTVTRTSCKRLSRNETWPRVSRVVDHDELEARARPAGRRLLLEQTTRKCLLMQQDASSWYDADAEAPRRGSADGGGRAGAKAAAPGAPEQPGRDAGYDADVEAPRRGSADGGGRASAKAAAPGAPEQPGRDAGYDAAADAPRRSSAEGRRAGAELARYAAATDLLRRSSAEGKRASLKLDSGSPEQALRHAGCDAEAPAAKTPADGKRPSARSPPRSPEQPWRFGGAVFLASCGGCSEDPLYQPSAPVIRPRHAARPKAGAERWPSRGERQAAAEGVPEEAWPQGWARSRQVWGLPPLVLAADASVQLPGGNADAMPAQLPRPGATSPMLRPSASVPARLGPEPEALPPLPRTPAPGEPRAGGARLHTAGRL